MSDTRRHCDNEAIWGPGVPLFDELFPEIRTRKYQERDRTQKNIHKNLHRKSFRKGEKRSRFQLKQDNTNQDLKEELVQL
jgi:hypothetical protein